MTTHYRDLSNSTAGTTAVRSHSYADKADSGIGHVPAATGLYRTVGKRFFDIVVVLLAAPFIVFFVGVLALFVARDGGKPFYSQKRVGQNGRIYTMWKMRSMVIDADDRLEQHLMRIPAARVEWDSTQKLKCDPRITAFGRFLRRSSMDELPQLWNVLIGDMSLVGPRPMMPCQRNLYSGTDYYDLRPGITGSWQVSARNESTFAARAEFDAQYNAELSAMTDIRLLLATVRVVMRGTGH